MVAYWFLIMSISIHALREEGDVGMAILPPKLTLFLSTPSARRATVSSEHCKYPGPISIHALREEGDQRLQQNRPQPCISIHALREEGDAKNL